MLVLALGALDRVRPMLATPGGKLPAMLAATRPSCGLMSFTMSAGEAKAGAQAAQAAQATKGKKAAAAAPQDSPSSSSSSEQQQIEDEKAVAEILSDDLSERCNVVLTHTNADFDTLAGAVALAKLWSIERPEVPTHVVMPRGVNPLVGRFLAYHKHLLPIRGFKTIREEDVMAVGVVDTQSIDRLGPAAPWLAAAEHVAVVDHHMGVSGDIHADELLLEEVGSATTVLVERLRAVFESGGGSSSQQASSQQAAAPGAPVQAAQQRAELRLTETEATLFALGIRADTGSLTYPATSPRDAYALAWLMENGSSQTAIAEFGQARLSAVQRDLLSESMASITLSRHEGLKIGSVLLDTGRGFVTGMSSVVEELLQLLGCDVVLMGVMHTNAKDQSFLSLIGRCSSRARSVDLNEVLSRWKGGGHPAAAAASIKLCSGEVEPEEGAAAGVGADADADADSDLCATPDSESKEVLSQALRMIVAQVPQQVTAGEIMTTTITTLEPTDTMEHALALMNRMRKRAVPVVESDDSGGRKLIGFVKYSDPVKAMQAGKGQQLVKAWARRELVRVDKDTPFAELEALLVGGSTGRLHVVDEEGHLIGLVSRTDMLMHYKHYEHAGVRRVR